MDAATGAAIVSGIATFGGIVTLILTQHYQAKRAREDRAKVKEKVEVVAEVLKAESGHNADKLTEIHTLVDGNLSKLQKEFKALTKAFAEAEKTIASMKRPKRPRVAPRRVKTK